MTTITHGQSAEQYAATLIRRALDSAVRPNLSEIADESALDLREVTAIRDRIMAARKQAATPPLAAPTVAADGWRQGINHPQAKVRRAAARAVAAVVLVEALLAEDADKAKLREREARLAAELAKVRAELRGGPVAGEKEPCPDCGDLINPSRLAVHRNRSKKHR